MTFDEAVRITNFPIYANLSNFKNPNGCPIQATFFVSHVDTNYKLVHELHRRGHEIASHSIRLLMDFASIEKLFYILIELIF
jgi:hypothetical protein